MTHATTTEQIAALEIFLEYLVIVIDAEANSFTIDKLNAWIDIGIQRMITTGSASPGTIGALWAMQARVLGA